MGGGGGIPIIMHGHSRMSIRPSHPYNAGTEHVGFSPTRQALEGGRRRSPTLSRCSRKTQIIFGSRASVELELVGCWVHVTATHDSSGHRTIPCLAVSSGPLSCRVLPSCMAKYRLPVFCPWNMQVRARTAAGELAIREL